VKRANIPKELSEKVINAIEAPGAEDELTALSDRYDRYDSEFETGNKKHRNMLSSFNHLYTIITHPFCIVIICVGILVIFAVTRYIGLSIDNVVVLKISSDFGLALSYVFTTIISSVFTKFLERHKRGPHL
jgi:uncharacterized membrane protein